MGGTEKDLLDVKVKDSEANVRTLARIWLPVIFN